MRTFQIYTDTELITLLSEGSQRAFESIYRKYASDLFRYARKNIAVKEDCEEIIQGVFESLWARRESLRHITILKAYLFRMVKYKVIRYFQHKAVKGKYAEHYILFEAVYDTVPEQERTAESIQDMILKRIAELPERCQMAFKLRLLENLSNGEIAQRMNIRRETVENYMVRAFSHLRAFQQEIYKTR